MSKVRSAKGDVVDFDLIKIKESIASDPAPTDVAARQQHIDQRLRRRMRNVKSTPLSTTPKAKQPAKSTVEVDKKGPATDDSDVELIDVIEDTKVDEPTITRGTQKARRKST